MPKIEILQATSPDGRSYLIQRFNDGNVLPSYEIYELVTNCKAVAREFGIQDFSELGVERNTRVGCNAKRLHNRQ